MIYPVSYAALMAAPNFGELIAEYASECSISLIGEIDPQPQTYAALENNRVLQCFGVYDCGKLIGFSALLVTPNPHYGKLVGSVESLFLSKPHRSGATGSALMRVVESFAKEAGCVVIGYSAPVGSQLERLLNLSKPYTRTNAIFMRPL